ncbi:MAG: hypothetical protein ACYDB7_05210 [Mycobacteriales bacterium]
MATTYRPGPVARAAAVVALSLAAGWLLAGPVVRQFPSRYAAWDLARASGISAFVLLTALVVLGWSVSHPARKRWTEPPVAARTRTHRALSAFLPAFVAVHVVALATDRYAGVGWWGAFLPGAAVYRPLPVGLGVFALDAGLIVGLTAAVVPVAARRWWRSVHRVAPVVWGLAWAHGALAGSDTPRLLLLYVGSGIVVLAAAGVRYVGWPTAHPRRRAAQSAAVRGRDS